MQKKKKRDTSSDIYIRYVKYMHKMPDIHRTSNIQYFNSDIIKIKNPNAQRMYQKSNKMPRLHGRTCEFAGWALKEGSRGKQSRPVLIFTAGS
jgi:hypothetical protein